MHEIRIALHPEVAVTVKVNVARSPEEADLQAQGIDVLHQMFERDAAPVVAEELAAGRGRIRAPKAMRKRLPPLPSRETPARNRRSSGRGRRQAGA